MRYAGNTPGASPLVDGGAVDRQKLGEIIGGLEASSTSSSCMRRVSCLYDPRELAGGEYGPRTTERVSTFPRPKERR